MHRSILSIALGATLVALPAMPAHASGFYLQEQSSRGAGRAFSGEVADTGASSLWWNPAAIAGSTGGEAALGFSAILPRSNLVDRGTLIVRPGQSPMPVGGIARDSRDPIHNGYLPSGAVSYGLTDRLAVGVSLSSPYSFTTSYGPASWTRYSALESRLRTYDVQPSIAIAPVPNLRLGAALNVERTQATLSNALPNLSPLLPDGRQRLHGRGWNLGFTAGGQLIFGPLTLGASYKSSIRHSLDGEVEVAGLLGPLASLNRTTATSATFRTPWQVDFGARLRVTSRLTLDGQANRIGWSRFDAIRLRAPFNLAVPENYRDSWSVAGGADYQLTPDWTVRGGVQRDRTPTSDGQRDARVPDGNHWNFATGTSYRLSRLTLDLAANYVRIADAAIGRNTAAYAGTPIQTPILTNGEADRAHVVVLTAGARLPF